MSLKKQEKPKSEKKEGSISKFIYRRKESAQQAKEKKMGQNAEAAGKGQAKDKAGQNAEKGLQRQEAGRDEQAKPKLAHGVKESILSKFFGHNKESKKQAGDAPKAMANGGEQTFAKEEPKTAPHGRQEQVIYTAIDQIIEIVDSRGEILLQEVSKILNIPQERMEELAKILDEHGILQLHYPSNPLAKPVLRSLTKHDFKQLGRQSQ